MLSESPSVDSGIHASRRSDDAIESFSRVVDEDRRRGDFCCNRAMYPAMLSLEDGVGWT